MEIITPPFIKPGDTIGITAPSFGCTTEPYATKFRNGCSKIESMGCRTKAGKTVFMNDGKGISSSPLTCARELEEFYCSDRYRAIISAGGGEMMCETAGLVDFEKICNAGAKWYCGYSDNTNFIHPLVTMAHVKAIYGPCISGFGKFWEQSETDTWEILTGKRNHVEGYQLFQLPENDTDDDSPNAKFNLTESKTLKSFVPDENAPGKLREAGSAEKIETEGILLGGCLDVLANICGTRLDKTTDFTREALRDGKRIIWVLEGCDGNPMEMRRQVWHLKNCGWFDTASGFLVGRPLASFRQKMMGVDQYNAYTDILGELNVPVICDCDIGHIDPAMPLVMGAFSRAQILSNSLRIEFQL
ncbi:MAG: LD-carboxypeptidase [Treponema sp.]|nr:LD-carboxypeptidase [Treponema sp.]